jgi:predicted XRE-type DNA-binding protein
MDNEDEAIYVSSGNVYEDFGVPDAEEMHRKAKLVIQIHKIIEERGLSQRQAANILGIDQPKISNMLRGRFRGFSVNRLMEFLNALDQDVEIIVRPKAADQEHGRTTVRLVAEEETAYAAEG